MQYAHNFLHRVGFRQLQTFVVLAQVENFSETGRRVGLSQSAVSRHILGLEEALGQRLFERRGRRAVLTSAGRALRTRLQTLMREAESLPRAIRDLAEGVAGSLRIGAAITPANAILPSVLGSYRRRYPNVELVLQPSRSAHILETLARGEIDVAFVACDNLPASTTALAEIPDELILVASYKHALAGRRLKPHELDNCDFIHRDVGSDTRSRAEQWFATEGVQTRVVMEVG